MHGAKLHKSDRIFPRGKQRRFLASRTVSAHCPDSRSRKPDNELQGGGGWTHGVVQDRSPLTCKGNCKRYGKAYIHSSVVRLGKPAPLLQR